MNAQDRYNSERYPDMTCFLALRNIERNERKERRNRMKENWIYRRGDVYLANLDPYIGSEQGGTRPVVVLQNDVGNRYAPTLIVATVTSRTEKKKYQPTHVLIAHNTAFEKPSVVQLEQIFTIPSSASYYPIRTSAWRQSQPKPDTHSPARPLQSTHGFVTDDVMRFGNR